MLVGIDLGTTFSAIARVDRRGNAEILENRDGERTTPSVVMFEDDTVIVGDTAKESSISEPGNVCQFVKRSIGDKSYTFRNAEGDSYTAEEISALILKRLKQDAEDAAGEEIEGAVITVPAYFGDAQRKATQDAGQIAGLNVLGIINEPTAAAISYCFGNAKTAGNVMVFDLGGGTFDITIIKMDEDFTKIQPLSTTGNRNLGGYDFDNLIIRKVKDAYRKQYGEELDVDKEAEQDLVLKAEDAKKKLSAREKATITLRVNGNMLKVDVTREEFEEMMEVHLERMENYMEDALDEADMDWGDISKILLVGGSSRIPCVQEMVERVSGIKPSHELNPDEAVALGAAYYAEMLADRENAAKNVEVHDISSHGLGVLAVNEKTGKHEMSTIIPKNSVLPATEIDIYSTTVDNQMAIRVKILEGDDIDPAYDTLLIEQLLDIPQGPKDSLIIAMMTYDTNGMVHLRLGFRKKLPGEDNYGEMEILPPINVERKSNMTTEQVARGKKRIGNLDVE
ncbi:MAG: Hsp70 family protein [Clostridia bacterium]|nr:Hsp70 family protein [Clostridia bacterium]